MPGTGLVYVGTYTEAIRFGTGQILQGKGGGIHAFRFDQDKGSLEPIGVTENVRNPSYLAFAPSKRFLYAVNELKEFEGKPGGGISAFAIDAASGALTFLNMKATHGTDPCHLIVDATGRFVLVANFMSGSVCVLPIGADGSLGDASDFIQHQGSSVDPVRQAGPHAHAVEIDNDNAYVFVPDLGLDRVVIYAFDSRRGKLTPNPHQPWIATRPGAGPRQLVMHPNGRFAYLINELDSTMTAYAYDAAKGMLAELQTLPTLPQDFTGKSTCAEVQITPDGAFLYGSNRGHDSLAIYRLDPATGLMSVVGHDSTGGKIPRNFEVHPGGRFIAAANQDSDNVVLLRLDPATGRMTRTGHVADAGTPICVRFM